VRVRVRGRGRACEQRARVDAVDRGACEVRVRVSVRVSDEAVPG